MLVHINQGEYIEGVSKAAGAITVIHSQKHMPFPEDFGILAKPGHITSIGMKKVNWRTFNFNKGKKDIYLITLITVNLSHSQPTMYLKFSRWPCEFNLYLIYSSAYSLTYYLYNKAIGISSK